MSCTWHVSAATIPSNKYEIRVPFSKCLFFAVMSQWVPCTWLMSAGLNSRLDSTLHDRSRPPPIFILRRSVKEQRGVCGDIGCLFRSCPIHARLSYLLMFSWPKSYDQGLKSRGKGKQIVPTCSPTRGKNKKKHYEQIIQFIHLSWTTPNPAGKTHSFKKIKDKYKQIKKSQTDKTYFIIS